MKGQSLIRMHEVVRRTGQSRSAILRLIEEGVFPRPVRISPRSVGWVEEEIDQYIKAKIAARDQRPKAQQS